MRIVSIKDTPLWEIPYQTAGPDGAVHTRTLPVLRGIVDELPPGVAALVACSDLQGLEMPRDTGTARRLLGEVLVQNLALLGEMGQAPPTNEIGALLLGDFYAGPDLTSRGLHGDVSPVWSAFAEHFRWVVGVAGNHDAFASENTARRNAAYLLDGEVIALDGLRIAGVSGIIGDTKKGRLWRRSEAEFMRAVDKVLRSDPALLLLHQSPEVSDAGLPGHPTLYAPLADHPNLLTICGHVHWPIPLTTLPKGGQIVNVDAQAILFSTSG